MLKKLLNALCLFAAVVAAQADRIDPAAASPRPFADGDVVCFVGDSITHSGTYHNCIYNYYLTRFPSRKIALYNCGIGGHTAEKTLVNFAWDVPKHNPSIITVMLGMNDLRRPPFDENVLDSYLQKMHTLTAMIKKQTRADIVYISSSPYDEYVEADDPALNGFNECLGKTSTSLAAMAIENKASFVDFFTPMNRLNHECKKDDPHFTLISQDRIHPGAIGNMIMAYLFLKAQNVPAMVWRATISYTDRTVTQDNCSITLEPTGNGILAFYLTANALPFAIPKAAKPALDIVPIEQELNQESLCIKNFPEGIYRLKIDEVEVGMYSNCQLDAGISLGFNARTPQNQQAQKILELTENKGRLEYMLQTKAMLKVLLKQHGIAFDGKDRQEVSEMFERQEVVRFFLPGGELAGGGPLRYWTRYQETKDELDAVEDAIDAIIEKLYKINRPQRHLYWLEKLK